MRLRVLLRPTVDVAHDERIRRFTDGFLDEYAISTTEHLQLLSWLEGALFELIDAAEGAAARMAERRAIERREQSHVLGHPECGGLHCRVVGAMRHRRERLGRQVAEDLALLRRLTHQ